MCWKVVLRPIFNNPVIVGGRGREGERGREGGRERGERIQREHNVIMISCFVS